MSNELIPSADSSIALETDKPLVEGLRLTIMESKIVERAALGVTPKSISSTLGIPVTTINRLLAKKEVSEALDKIVEARNKAILAHLPTLLIDIIEDKVAMAKESDGRLADVSKRDVVDIAKTISDIIKAGTSTKETEATGLTAFYQTFNLASKE